MSTTGPAHWQCLKADDGPLTLPQGSLVLIPVPRDLERCRKHLEHKAVVHLEAFDAIQTKRDMAFHAQLRTVFKNLREIPETGVSDYNEFRKFCLVRTGWYKDKVHVFASEQIAAEVRPAIAENVTGFCLVLQDGNTITVRRARSQSIGRSGEMTPTERYQSYDDVLDFGANLIEVTRHQIALEAQNNA